jgi:hypothetical protein
MPRQWYRPERFGRIKRGWVERQTARARTGAYNEFRQRVRRFRRSDVLRAVASLAADLQQAAFGEGPAVQVPDYVSEFSLAGVARPPS